MSRLHRFLGLLSILVLLSPDAFSESPRMQQGNAFSDKQFTRQYQALTRSSLPVDVEYTKRGAVRMVQGKNGDTAFRLSEWRSLKKGDRAPKILESLSDLLMATGTEELIVDAVHPVMGGHTINLWQTIRGTPVVEGGFLSIGVRPTGAVWLLYSYFVPDHDLAHTPSLSAEEAAKLAVAFIAGDPDTEENSAEMTEPPKLVYYGGAAEGAKPALVWAVKVSFVSVPTVKRADWNEVFVNAVTGMIEADRPLAVVN